MGLYDNVVYDCRCPCCGAEISGFQTKEGECALGYLRPTEVTYFYSVCPGCSAWVEFRKLDNYAYNDGIDRGFGDNTYLMTVKQGLAQRTVYSAEVRIV
jgi:hypothetical protein